MASENPNDMDDPDEEKRVNEAKLATLRALLAEVSDLSLFATSLPTKRIKLQAPSITTLSIDIMI